MIDVYLKLNNENEPEDKPDPKPIPEKPPLDRVKEDGDSKDQKA